MSDIVERLRAFRPVYGWPEEYATVKTVPMNEEAAAEIERLRARIKTLEKGNADLAMANKVRRSQTSHLNTAEQRALNANREVDRLRSELETVLSREAETTKRHDAKLDALEARLAEAVEMLHRVYFASRIDVLMEGPRLQGWNRPELDRLWPELRDLVAKLEQKP